MEALALAVAPIVTSASLVIEVFVSETVALAWRTDDPSPALAQLLDTVAADPGFADPPGGHP